ncbi:MAG: NAD(P)/FAD-dependent oxidoreductase, partial [Myxococcales bacterium]|nr:NAD(P)/FAD-dependent oxidoreductase [Myxococcales bacterium]
HAMNLPADDATLAEALESANLPALLPAIVQLTGDASLLQRFPAPSPGMMGAVDGNFSPEDQAAIRALAFEVLKTYRDGDANLPPLPSKEQLHEIMNWCAGESLPPEYVPLAIEEAALEEPDPRRFEWGQRPDPAVLRDFHVVIIGAGFGGVCAAVRLEQAGIAYTICEKNDSVGGTWYENSYPDLRVDVPNHFYSYSFEPNPDWSNYFSRRDELEAYIGACARKHGILERVRLGTEVVEATYDEPSAQWRVRIRGEDGSEEVLTANAVISAVGMLNRPQFPSIDGVDSFEGPCFHSSRWQHDVEFEGKRVGVIGTGASAMQFVPRLAENVSKLTVFQRAAHWATFNASYRATISDEFKWLLRHVPYYHGWYRFLLFWAGSDRVFPVFRIDPDWEHPDRSIGMANDMFRTAAITYIKAQLANDPELIDKCIPDYPPLGKRPLLDNGWYKTLTRDNVELVTDGIREVTPDAVITADGTKHPLDVLVLATGFHAGKFLWPMQIIGRGGVVLQDRWEGGENPRAYLGITMPDFPNLFCMYGPNTNPVVGSVIFMLECQTNYIMGCLRALIENGHRSLECREGVHDEYNERLDAEMEKMVWRHPNVRSYYNNSAGRVITNVPWTMYAYWNMTRTPDLAEFHVR